MSGLPISLQLSQRYVTLFRTTGMRTMILASALLLAGVSASANPFGQLTVLIPLTPGTVAGAGGTQWTTTLWAANTSDRDLAVACTSLVAINPPVPSPLLTPHSTPTIT